MGEVNVENDDMVNIYFLPHRHHIHILLLEQGVTVSSLQG